jgi:putative transposase
VIGYALSTRLDTGLAMEALEMALRGRNPQPGCIHHSDRGVQYASAEYIQALKDHGFQISMSRRGNPYDNAMAESFFKTLKQEEVYLTEYQTIHDVRDRLPRFLEDVYNRKRLHSSLGYLPPSEFECNWNLEHNASREGCTLLTQSVQS